MLTAPVSPPRFPARRADRHADRGMGDRVAKGKAPYRSDAGRRSRRRRRGDAKFSGPRGSARDPPGVQAWATRLKPLTSRRAAKTDAPIPAGFKVLAEIPNGSYDGAALLTKNLNQYARSCIIRAWPRRPSRLNLTHMKNCGLRKSQANHSHR